MWRAFVDLTGNAEERARTPAMSAAQICATYARPLASGLLLRDGETLPPERQEAWQNLIGLTQQAILDRQRCNGDCSRPLAFELDPILRKIGSRLAQVAKGLYLRAEAEENRIAMKFDGWLPAEKPTDAFTKKWTGLINTASGNVTCLFARDTGSIPGADGDLPLDQLATARNLLIGHRIAARVAAAAPAQPLPPARSTVLGPDAPTRVLARIPPGAGPGQLLRLQPAASRRERLLPSTHSRSRHRWYGRRLRRPACRWGCSRRGVGSGWGPG